MDALDETVRITRLYQRRSVQRMYQRTLNLGFDPELDVDRVHPWSGHKIFCLG